MSRASIVIKGLDGWEGVQGAEEGQFPRLAVCRQTPGLRCLLPIIPPRHRRPPPAPSLSRLAFPSHRSPPAARSQHPLIASAARSSRCLLSAAHHLLQHDSRRVPAVCRTRASCGTRAPRASTHYVCRPTHFMRPPLQDPPAAAVLRRPGGARVAPPCAERPTSAAHCVPHVARRTLPMFRKARRARSFTASVSPATCPIPPSIRLPPSRRPCTSSPACLTSAVRRLPPLAACYPRERERLLHPPASSNTCRPRTLTIFVPPPRCFCRMRMRCQRIRDVLCVCG
ncbi:hypothetical protein GGX14DRAFT_576968 [Mycena pura]|uniref:Uncharacterized protein n=1 Tax=Mycena pura TaxID=153505 RepID=A0AAD6UVV6_9AGAR|nr:hypothetical protein GGX14DRAFT_576968 [Mycena pura]